MVAWSEKLQTPMRECVDGCGRRKRTYTEHWVCKFCTDARLENPLSQRAKTSVSSESYNPEADPFFGLESLADPPVVQEAEESLRIKPGENQLQFPI